MTTASEPLHAATASVVDVLYVLLRHAGWLGTKDVAGRAGLQKDTTRRILLELERRGWVERHAIDDVDAWTLGAELPRVGLAYLDRLGHEQARLRGLALHATMPWQSETRGSPDFTRHEDVTVLGVLLGHAGAHVTTEALLAWTPGQRASAWIWALAVAGDEALLASMVPPHVRAITPELDR